MKETNFNFEGRLDHIVNKIFSNFKDMDITRYKEIVRNARLKIGNYNNFCNFEQYYLELSSENEVEQFANEIYYFNQGVDELIEDAKSNDYAKFELGIRYYYMGENEKAFKELYNLVANQGKEGSRFYVLLEHMKKVLKKCEEKNINSKYKGMRLGLPFNIPFTRK